MDFATWVNGVEAGSGEKWKIGKRRRECQLSSCMTITQLASLGTDQLAMQRTSAHSDGFPLQKKLRKGWGFIAKG